MYRFERMAAMRRFMMKMNQEWKNKWLIALRSGLYQQTVQYLRNLDYTEKGNVVCYCCLGVLCQIVDAEGWDSPDPDRPTTHRGSASYPGYEICEETGLTETLAAEAAALNDDGKSFSEIADWIEETL